MVVLALPFAYLHFRSGGITSYVFGGVLIGISFFLLNNVFGYIGNLRNWWPWLTAAAPGPDLLAAVAGRLQLAGAAAMSAARHRPVRARLARPALARADRGRRRAHARSGAAACPCPAPTWNCSSPTCARPSRDLVARRRHARHRRAHVPGRRASMPAKTCPRWCDAVRTRASRRRPSRCSRRRRGQPEVLDLLADIALCSELRADSA